MAYASAESGRYEVYVQPVPAGHGKWPISTHGGVQPVWGRDGKELYYKSTDKIVAVPVKIGASFEAGAPKELFAVSAYGLSSFRRQYSVTPMDSGSWSTSEYPSTRRPSSCKTG